MSNTPITKIKLLRENFIRKYSLKDNYFTETNSRQLILGRAYDSVVFMYQCVASYFSVSINIIVDI